MIHAFGFLSYDSDRKKLAFFGSDGLNRYYQGGLEFMEPGMKLIDEQLKGKKKSAYSPWYYDVATDKFERTPANGSLGYAHQSFPQFHYIPARRQFLVVGAAGVASFDIAKNEWSDRNPKGPRPRGYDGCGCYDSKRNRIYRNDGDGADAAKDGLMAYDLESNAWSYLKPSGNGPDASMGTNSAYYEYNPVLDLVVVIQMTGKTLGIHTYNPNTNSWADMFPFPVSGPRFLGFAANVVYDRELNAYFCHVARDSEENGTMWVYRHKSAK